MATLGAYYRYQAYRRRRRNRRGVSRWLIALAVLGVLSAITLGAGAVAGYGVYRIYDREGKLLFEYLNPDFGRREPVPLSDISPFLRDGHLAGPLIDATIAAEDASFWDNPGINFRGLTNAALDNLSPFGDTPGFLQGRGGSSITQQLVKNVYFTPEERGKRSIDRKLKETVYALELTRQYSKEQILEWYLSLISYGNLYTGVEAASRGYFGKPAKDLTVAEAALLAGIPANPTRFDPINNPENAKSRQVHVLTRMFEEGYITGAEAYRASFQALEVSPQRFPVQAPHFVFNVIQPELERLFGEEALLRDGLEVYTTIDLKWQQRAEAILEEHISELEERTDGHNGAFVAIDPTTAETLVYIGSRDYFREDIDGQNDTAAALNSPGSSFKPFAYLTAFINLGWGPGTMILDTPYTYRDVSGTFTPENPGGGFLGPITLRKALGNSLNIPAVKTAVYAGVPNIVDQAANMGITALKQQQLGPALVTGGGDIRLSEVTYGYTAFANLGILKGIPAQGERPLDPVTILRVEDRDGNMLYPLVDGEPVDGPTLQEVRVAPAEETYLVNHILVDPSAECIIFGCGGLSIPDGRPLAVKTGTSVPYENCRSCTGDTLTFAYTPQLVVGTWYGNADNSPMRNVSSTTVSWPIVRDFMAEYHADLPVLRWSRPSGVVQASVCILSGLKPTPEDHPNCPTTPEDLFAQRSLPERDDDWWTLARVDTRTEKLAPENTPNRFVEERYYLQLPDGLSEFEREQAEEWVDELNNLDDFVVVLGDPPTEETQDEDLPAVISSPANGAEVHGDVLITGWARSANFALYGVQYRPTGSPNDWILITSSTEPVEDGTLAIWDTSGLAPGTYTIQLVLVDELLGELTSAVQVELVAPEQERDQPGRGPPEDD
jgi:membrane peptidoglycan carboxypeptidase